jgi:hypothetical protein
VSVGTKNHLILTLVKVKKTIDQIQEPVNEGKYLKISSFENLD